MSRLNIILLVLAILQGLVLVGFLIFSSDDKAVDADARALVTLEPGDIDRIVLSDGAADGETLEIARTEAGFVFPTKDNFPADTAKVESLLLKLSGAKRARELFDSGKEKLASSDLDALIALLPKDDDRRAVLAEFRKKMGDEDSMALNPSERDDLDDNLKSLRGIVVERPVIRSKKNHGPVKVADNRFDRKIELKTAKESSTLFVARGTRGQTSYIRRGGEESVFETDVIETWDLRPDVGAWAPKDLLSFATQDATKIELELKDDLKLIFNKVAAAKEVDSDPEPIAAWQLEGATSERPTKTSAVDAVLNDLSGLSISEVLGKEAPKDQGLKAPLGRATITLKSGKTVTLSIGTKDEKAARRALKSSELDWYIQVSSWRLDGLLEKTREDFLEAAKTDEDDTAPAPGDGN